MPIGDFMSDVELSVSDVSEINIKPSGGDEWTIRGMFCTTAASTPSFRWPNIADQSGLSSFNARTITETTNNIGNYSGGHLLYITEDEFFRIRNESGGVQFAAYFARKNKD